MHFMKRLPIPTLIAVIYSFLCICDAFHEKITYVGKSDFAVQRKIAGNLEKVEWFWWINVLYTFKNQVKTQYSLIVYE